MMKMSEIKQFTDLELNERIEDEANLLVRMELNHIVSPMDNPQKIKQTRRNIARLKTEFKQRQLNTNKK